MLRCCIRIEVQYPFNNGCGSIPVGRAAKKANPTAVAAKHPCKQHIFDFPVSSVTKNSKKCFYLIYKSKRKNRCFG